MRHDDHRSIRRDNAADDNADDGYGGVGYDSVDHGRVEAAPIRPAGPRHAPVDQADLEPAALEPDVDPDAGERVLEEHPDPPHPASRYDAGTGQGTVTGPPYDVEVQERPILDGSTESAESEASVPNPYRGLSDPARVFRQPAVNSTNTRRWLTASVIAVVVVSTLLLLLARWDPVWCGVGIVVAVLAFAAMILVRASKIERPARLRLEAILMAVLWLVPLAIILTVMIGHRGEIWG